MASPVTQLLAPAVAQVAPPTHNTHPARESTGNLTPSQLVQTSQLAAEKSLRTTGEKRATQVPKRVEGGFESQRGRKKAGRKASEEEKENEGTAAPRGNPSRLDVVA